MLTCVTCACYFTSLGWGAVLTFMLTCVTCTCYTSRHWVGGGDVNVHVNLRQMHMLRHVAGLGGAMLTFMLTCVTCTCYVMSLGWGVMLTFMLTCVRCTCYVTSLGWGGDVNVHVNLRHMHMLRHVTGLGALWGDVNVHVNLRHMHMLRHVTGLRGILTILFTCVTCTC